MTKQMRQRAIVEIVSKSLVQSQGELTAEFKKVGFNVTQATVCRDVGELKLLKSRSGYMLSYDPTRCRARPLKKMANTLKQGVVKVEKAHNLVVIKTLRGMAQQVGIAFESGQFDGVVGTIAGSDTVALITQSIDEAHELNSAIEEMLA